MSVIVVKGHTQYNSKSILLTVCTLCTAQSDMIFVKKFTRPAFLGPIFYTKSEYIATMANLRQISVNASKCQISDKNVKMLAFMAHILTKE